MGVEACGWGHCDGGVAVVVAAAAAVVVVAVDVDVGVRERARRLAANYIYKVSHASVCKPVTHTSG